jgi:hypothetical protein
MLFETGKEKTFISRHILHQHWYTCPIALPLRRNSQHRNLLTFVSATSAPPFQPLRHQQNVCHPVMNRFTRTTLPTVNRKHFFMYILCIESFCSERPHKQRWSSIVYSSSRVTTLTTKTSLWTWACESATVDCHEAGLCCYLVIHMENLLRPLQLLYFHLWPTSSTDWPS